MNDNVVLMPSRQFFATQSVLNASLKYGRGNWKSILYMVLQWHKDKETLPGDFHMMVLNEFYDLVRLYGGTVCH